MSSRSGSEPPSPILVAHVKSAPADSRKDSQKPSSSRHASLASSRVSRDGRRSSVRRSLDWLERARRNRKESLKARKERKVEMGLKAFGDALRNPMKSLKKTLLVSMIILSVFIPFRIGRRLLLGGGESRPKGRIQNSQPCFMLGSSFRS